jgi:hypothetical protein
MTNFRKRPEEKKKKRKTKHKMAKQCFKNVKIMSKSWKKLSNNCQQVVKKSSISCQKVVTKVVKKLSKICSIFEKGWKMEEAEEKIIKTAIRKGQEERRRKKKERKIRGLP